jgi:serine/threonine-protein kinase
MAAVYLARRDSGRAVAKWYAVKVVHPQLADEPEFVEMLFDEARLVARVEHPNVAATLDAGLADGSPYLAMEFLRGQSLGAILRARKESLPLEIVARIGADVAWGLHAAHELREPDGALADVVHRDVSPQNIIVTYQGLSKIVDFGIARSRSRLAERTATGVTRGKIAYMAPEQLRGGRLDRRTDVFALGVVIWEASLGQRLFKCESEAATTHAVLTAPIPRPTEIDPTYPSALEAVVMQALERDADRRAPDAEFIARGLEAYLASARRPAAHAQVGEFMRSHFAANIASSDELLRAIERGQQAEATGGARVDTNPVAEPTESAVDAVPTQGHERNERETATRMRRTVLTLAIAAASVAGLFALVHGMRAPASVATTQTLGSVPRPEVPAPVVHHESAQTAAVAGTTSLTPEAPQPPRPAGEHAPRQLSSHRSTTSTSRHTGTTPTVRERVDDPAGLVEQYERPR